MRSLRLTPAAPLAALALASLSLLAVPAAAQTLTGAGANWTLDSGFNVNDATYGGQTDAFDTALVVSVNGAQFTPATVGSVVTTAAGQSITGTGTAAGLNVTKEYLALSSAPVLRTLLSFTNLTADAISFSLLLQNNNGSDSSTQVITTASGDTLFIPTDGWIITDDAAVGGDPTNTHVVSVGGARPDNVGLTVFNASGTQGVSAEWLNVVIGAGETGSFVFFNRLDTTAANAQTAAPTFDSGASVEQAGYLAGLSAGQVSGIRNLSGATGAATVPEPATLGLFGAGALLGTAVVARRRRSAGAR